MLTNSLLASFFIIASILASAEAFTFNKNALNLVDALSGMDSRAAFDAWATHHRKEYDGEETRAQRFGVWLSNAKVVVARNAMRTPGQSKLGLNGLADLSSEEFRATMLSPIPFSLEADSDQKEVKGSGEKEAPVSWRYENVKAAESVDWREAGVVGPIRSQHANNWSCGGCWAFATAGISEIASAMLTHKVIPASEQQLIDCDDKHDHGCNGGDFRNGLDYIIYNKGLTSEELYPYAGQNGKCVKHLEKEHLVKIDDWESVPPFNETALAQALTMRPVVSAICCGSNLDDWHHYDGGVFDMPCCQDKLSLDHAIVLVGYGTTPEGEDYYILKNSWSTAWGEEGFMKIKRGVGPKPFVSQCGLASMPTMVFRGPKPSSVPFSPAHLAAVSANEQVDMEMRGKGMGTDLQLGRRGGVQA